MDGGNIVSTFTARRIALGTLRSLAFAVTQRATLLSGALTVVALSDSLLWWFEWARNMHHAYLVLAALSCPVLFALRSRFWAVIASGTVLVNAWIVLPAYVPPPNRSARDSPPAFRLLTANVFYDNFRHHALLDLVRETEPDILCVQEFSAPWDSIIPELKEHLPYCSLDVPDPDAKDTWAGDRMVFSRHKARVTKNYILDDNSYFSVLKMETFLDGRWVSVMSCHTTPVNNDQCRQTSQREFVRLAQIARDEPRPLIMAGDFNQTLWAPRFRQFETGSGLITARRGEGVLTTYPIVFDWFGLPIDHILVSPDIEISRCWVGPDIGSDHRPMLIDFSLKPSTGMKTASLRNGLEKYASRMVEWQPVGGSNPCDGTENPAS